MFSQVRPQPTGNGGMRVYFVVWWGLLETFFNANDINVESDDLGSFIALLIELSDD